MYLESSVGSLNRALVFSLALVSFACLGQRETSRPAASVVGVVCVTGNEPFTFLSVQTDDGVMHRIQKDTTELYRALGRLQGQKVRLQYRLPAADSSAITVERYEIVKDR